MGLKKRLCNPPAEQIALHGDPEVAGLFIGAGRGAPAISDIDLRREFEEKVVAIEASYLNNRAAAARYAIDSMHEIINWILAANIEEHNKNRT